jgi:hypothetical protein
MSEYGAQSMPDSVQTVREVSIPLFQAKGWMKLLGTLLIISGIFYVITIVGILVCWLPIWMGILLFKAADEAEAAQLAGEKTRLVQSLSKLKTFFTIQGVLILITIVFFVIGLIVSGGSMLAGLSHMR